MHLRIKQVNEKLIGLSKGTFGKIKKFLKLVLKYFKPCPIYITGRQGKWLLTL